MSADGAPARRLPTVRAMRGAEVPCVTAEQMREVDRIVVEDLHLVLLQMMENAGRHLADAAVRRFGPARCSILAGKGGNGGGGLVAARHLHNRGVDVRVVLGTPSNALSPAAAHQLDILTRMTVPIDDTPSSSDLVIDALIGYSLSGSPSGRVAELIHWANQQPSPVLSLDAPSGLDVTSGDAMDPCIYAAATVTLALPKCGLRRAPLHVGELWLADISIPAMVYQQVGLDVPALFSTDGLIRLPLEEASDD